jgi:hypothetical protein
MNAKLMVTVEAEIQKILNQRFDNPTKQAIKKTSTTYRFACPYCGDSEHAHKKRGNMFLETASYFCFNCGKHATMLNFFNFFKTRLDIRHITEIREVMNTQIKKSFSAYNDDIKHIQQYALDKKWLFKKIGLKGVMKSHEFVKKRLIHHRLNKIARKGNDIYILNLLDDTHVLGFEIKINALAPNKKSYYKKYNISKIYEEFVDDEYDIDAVKELDKISLLNGFFDVDFNKPVTIFEGAIDSWFYHNSMASSSVNNDTSFLDDNPNTQYMFDNDSAGKAKMIKKLKNGKRVFMWELYLSENKLPDDIKDLNELIIFLHRKKQLHKAKLISKYFSNNSFDCVYI